MVPWLVAVFDGVRWCSMVVVEANLVEGRMLAAADQILELELLAGGKGERAVQQLV